MKKSIVLGSLLLLIVIGFYIFLNSQMTDSAPIQAASVKTPLSDTSPSDIGAAPAHLSNDTLAQGIEALSNADSTQYSVYICYPDEDRPEYSYHANAMRSASMIKVFILGAAMEKIRDGQLSLSRTITLHAHDKVGGAGVLTGYADGSELSLDTILRLMITESDNTATNLVIDLLGMNEINAYIQRGGYVDTILQRKMMDTEAVAAGRENYSSAPDLGHFFHKLYAHSCVSPALDDRMLDYLKGQTDTECFPAALPHADIAHKTGELAGLYDDGGIIYMPDRTFIMVCMTENYSSRGRAIHTLRQMAVCAAKN